VEGVEGGGLGMPWIGVLLGYAVEGLYEIGFPCLPLGRGGGVVYVYRRTGGVGSWVRSGEVPAVGDGPFEERLGPRGRCWF